MAREKGAKTVTFSPDELDQLGLTFEPDIGATVKARLLSSDVSEILDADVLDFVRARAVGIGFSEKEVLSSLLRSQMLDIMRPSKADETKEAA